ncbi:hypothetical protein Bpro_3585 [Polaromonas sp. JS666]|nr:hypothetical protein Bpro_3585 [Polaromonas sp. JS666]
MNLLLIVFIVFGAASLLCILILAIFKSELYFSHAFLKNSPKIFGPDAAPTDEIICYWVTKIFLICFVCLLSIYLFNMMRN